LTVVIVAVARHNGLRQLEREDRMKVREGAALRRMRQRRDLSQRELAFLARPCSQTTIYLLETRRQAVVNDDLAMRIARRLGVGVDTLFEDELAPLPTA
jgi:transcriptional regulator with XRE-family HTH domain